MARLTAFHRGDLTFAVRDTGPEDGPPVVLLHGFPQNSKSWIPVAERLNAAGYRTLIPDQRGYSPEASPSGRRNYHISELSDDIAALIEQAGLGPVHLVGHDWGSGVAWAVAANHPELLRSLTAVSVPHPTAFLLSMLSSSQILLSWYMMVAQLPFLPEYLVRQKDGFFHHMLRRSGQSSAGALRDIEILRRGNTASTAVNYYRAIPYAMLQLPVLSKSVSVPTLQVWSDGDIAVGRKGHELSRKFVKGPWKLVELEGVSHWIPEEAPDRLAELIIEHAQSAQAVS